MRKEPNEIKNLIDLFAKLPGLGPVSSRRIVLYLLKNGNRKRLTEIASVMQKAADNVRACVVCGNYCLEQKCTICLSPERSNREICVVQDVSDLWAVERAGAFRGRYHILGGVLSMLDHVGPDELRIPDLMKRVKNEATEEVILALGATVDGQTTAHYIAEQLIERQVRITTLGQGVPMGGELEILDGGTITAAMRSRREY